MSQTPPHPDYTDTAHYVIVNRAALGAGILVGIGGEHDTPPTQQQLDRAVEMLFRNNPTVYTRNRIASPDESTRFLVIDALTNWINTHGEISDDPDDITGAATAVWDALSISGDTPPSTRTSDDAREHPRDERCYDCATDGELEAVFARRSHPTINFGDGTGVACPFTGGTEDADWDAITTWCGGYLINTEIADSGDYSTSLMIPREGQETLCACDGDIIVRLPTGSYAVYERKEGLDDTRWWNRQHELAHRTSDTDSE